MARRHEVHVILPPVASSQVDLDLVALTKAMEEQCTEHEYHGYGLGGESGYGHDYESDTFLMHQFCWCEREDCVWCSGCGCDRGKCRFFLDGKQITKKQYNAEFVDYAGPMPHDIHEHGTPEYAAYNKEWDAKIAERNRRYSILYPAVVHSCEPSGLMEGRSEGDWYGGDRWRAPNFWHKPSGLKVWWYKWIGRDMEFSRDVTAVEWAKFAEECQRAVGGAHG